MIRAEEGRAEFERTARFSAVHRYERREWSREENRRVFGELVEPHPHEWTVTVVTTGPISGEAGFSVDLAALDRALEELIAPLRNCELNQAIPPVREGALLPSCEVLARWFFEELAPRVPPPARLLRVRVAESDQIAASWVGRADGSRGPRQE